MASERDLSARRSLTRAEWALLLLLVASILINYVDRGNLSVSASLIQAQLQLSPAQIGALLGAFSWTYALAQLCGVSGWIADRFHVAQVLAAGFVIWSAATVATGLLSTFAALFAVRLVLGLGESIAYPCYSKLFTSYLPSRHLGRANALLDAGSKLGPALSSLLAGLFLVQLGWRAFFIGLGLASCSWMVPWLLWMRRSDLSCAPVDSQRAIPPARELLSLRSAWGTFAGHFCGNYFWFFLLTWIPLYLVRERNFTIGAMAAISTLLYLITATSTVCMGWISDALISKGYSRTAVRKSVVVAGLVCSSIILPVAFIRELQTGLIFLFASCVAFGAYASNHWAITQTLAGPLMAGRWTSIQNGIGNLSGILAPGLAGIIVQATGSSRYAFVLSAGIAICGAFFWNFVVGSVNPVIWDFTLQRTSDHAMAEE